MKLFFYAYKSWGMTQFDIFHVFVENSVNSELCCFWSLLQTAKIWNLSKNAHVWATQKMQLYKDNITNFFTPLCHVWRPVLHFIKEQKLFYGQNWWFFFNTLQTAEKSANAMREERWLGYVRWNLLACLSIFPPIGKSGILNHKFPKTQVVKCCAKIFWFIVAKSIKIGWKLKYLAISSTLY